MLRPSPGGGGCKRGGGGRCDSGIACAYDEEALRGVGGVLVTSPFEYMNLGDGSGEGTGKSDAE